MIRAALLLPLLLTAAAPTAFRPGEWSIDSAPTAATLDGKPLGDLPYGGGAGAKRVCLSPEDAKGTAWLTRDFAPGCTVTHATFANGRVDIMATCPPSMPGLKRGTIWLNGRWTPTSYSLRFATFNPSENGLMGFTGTMTGERVGTCPAPPSVPVTPAQRP